MRVILNKLLPFGRGMLAINLFGIILAKRPLDRVESNHEYIHTLQQRELLFVGFYLLYVLEWIFRLCQHRNFLRAYFAISFEREAYANQKLLDYRKTRSLFAWRRYL